MRQVIIKPLRNIQGGLRQSKSSHKEQTTSLEQYPALGTSLPLRLVQQQFGYPLWCSKARASQQPLFITSPHPQVVLLAASEHNATKQHGKFDLGIDQSAKKLFSQCRKKGRREGGVIFSRIISLSSQYKKLG